MREPDEAADPVSDNDASAERTLFTGDTGRFDFDTRVALVKLLRGPYLDGRKDAARWAALRRSESTARQFLAELFLVLVVDETEQIAFTQQAADADLGAPTVLRQVPLTMIDSALVLFLRQSLSAAAGTGQRAIVGTDDIVAQLAPYRRDSSTDESSHRKRINGSMTKMLDAGVLATTSTPDRFEVSPVLRILFPAEQISALLTAYEQLRDGSADAAAEATDAEAPDVSGFGDTDQEPQREEEL